MSKLRIGKHLSESSITEILDLLLNDDKEFLISLFRDYISSTAERVISLREDFAASDFESISLTSHAHSGSSGIIGAHVMQRLCHRIERKIKDDTNDELQELIVSFAQIASETEKDLKIVIEYLENFH
ncbi:MAG: Hpt domain-containing protein [Calditrichaeota bacterium]|nr:Hpt domain-containing protein [Calditrichota bacterium]